MQTQYVFSSFSSTSLFSRFNACRICTLRQMQLTINVYYFFIDVKQSMDLQPS